MDSFDEPTPSSEMWPPGTVRLESLQKARSKDIILQPHPSDDPNDPLNWSAWAKVWNFSLCAFYAMMVFALVNAATPTWGPMNVQLGFRYSILNDSYAIGCGTMAFGAFLLIPFALKYGRRPIYIVSTLAQFAISVWSAKLETVADLMLINALSCVVGALAEVIVQVTIADIFFVHHRGLANTIYVWFVNFGSSLAPVAAGYMTISQGWRWVWWWCAILFGVCAVLFIFSYEDTKYTSSRISESSSEIQQGSLAKGKDETGALREKTPPVTSTDSLEAQNGTQTPNLSVPTMNPNIPRKTYWQRLVFATTSKGSFKQFVRHAYQPAVILFTFPAVGYMSCVYGVMLAWSTVMVTVLSSYMTLPPYNFNSAQIGLMSLPSFIGTTLGSLVIGPLSDWSILYLAHRNKGIYEPEMRLWGMAPFVPFVSAGALMFGIGLNNGLPWAVVAVGYAICNFGSAPISSIALTYITDSYTDVSLAPMT
jgi:MFS family permease